jgi:hypothetical protein
LVDRDRLQDFRARFGLESDPTAFTRFRTRVIQAARTSLNLLIDSDGNVIEERFAFRNGSRFTHATSWGAGGHSRYGVIEELERAESFRELIERIQHLLWTFEELKYFEKRDRYGDSDYAGLAFVSKLREAIDLSPDVDLRLRFSTPGKADLVTAGVPLLDDVVDRSVQWLSRYADVQKEFRQALTILAEKKEDQFRQAQDSLRFGLEKLLKILLSNSVPLEEQGKPLRTWLTERGIHDNLRDVAVQIMLLLSKQYQNAAVKHDNAVGSGATKTWRPFEVEYVIYQYASLFRLLAEAADSESTDSNV